MMAGAVALAILLQAGLLLAQSGVTRSQWPQAAVESAALAALAYQLWQARRHLPPHADMLLLMASFGGLGMAAAGLPEWGAPSCHRGDWSAFWRMSGIMWMAGVTPAFHYSRCLRQARREGRLISSLLFDAAGMLVGMLAAHRLTAAWPLLWHYGAMNAAMLLGMGLAMRLRPAVKVLRLPRTVALAAPERRGA